MNEEEINEHAKRYWKKTNKKYYSWLEKFRLESPEVYRLPIEKEYTRPKKEPFLYALRVLDKKRLLSQETRAILYKIVGDGYLAQWIFSEARKYYLFAGRKDLIALVEAGKKRSRRMGKETRAAA
jgi:hypothetical protein